jgi:hypothetical protein
MAGSLGWCWVRDSFFNVDVVIVTTISLPCSACVARVRLASGATATSSWCATGCLAGFGCWLCHGLWILLYNGTTWYTVQLAQHTQHTSRPHVLSTPRSHPPPSPSLSHRTRQYLEAEETHVLAIRHFEWSAAACGVSGCGREAASNSEKQPPTHHPCWTRASRHHSRHQRARAPAQSQQTSRAGGASGERMEKASGRWTTRGMRTWVWGGVWGRWGGVVDELVCSARMLGSSRSSRVEQCQVRDNDNDFGCRSTLTWNQVRDKCCVVVYDDEQ